MNRNIKNISSRYSSNLSSIVFFLYFNASVIYSLPEAIRSLLGMIFVFWAIVIFLMTDNGIKKSIHVTLAWALIVATYYAIVALYTNNVFWSVVRASNLSQIILITLSLIIISNRISFDEMSKLIAISVLLMSAYVIHTSRTFSNSEYQEVVLTISAARSNLSVWLAFCVPFVFHALRNKLHFILLVVPLVLLAQIALGGRNGVLVSLFIIAFVTYTYWKKFLVIGLVLAPPFLYFILDQYYYQLRLERLQGIDPFSIDAKVLDYITAGRFSQYIWSIEKFQSSPLIGHGFDAAFFNDFPIHNMYLRVLVEGGLMMLVLIMYLPIKMLFIKKPEHQRELATTRVTIYGALIAALFEPYIIFGTMAYSIPVWIAVAYTMVISNTKNSSQYP